MLEPIYKLVKIQHFDKGTYSDYVALSTNPKSVLSEGKFAAYRKTYNPSQLFKYNSDSINGIMNHMKAEKEKDNLYKIYYLKDINSENEKNMQTIGWLLKKMVNGYYIMIFNV
ncbi:MULTISPECIES: hypothetical protein [Clostridium]|uniref:Uncharacterized protein n=1 Tax=Clostridium frigoriphilum TaxID=443253 RepID=A0ABU7UMZ0_9CLOT|nr:hypothetical protein [Clostridium sp. DSM 17811]MBU3097671.1 hypothetical protein [Clostridium sp. DSM 17811]